VAAEVAMRPRLLLLPACLLACSEYEFNNGKSWTEPDSGWTADADGDDVPDGRDPDDDNDGVPDTRDPDDDDDGIPDTDDPDDDNDGVPDWEDDDDDGDGYTDDVDDDDDGDGIPDVDDPDGGGGGTDDPDDIPEDFDDCVDGYYADYFNLPADHHEVEQQVDGVLAGDSPSNHDWFNPEYWVFRTVDPNLEFGTGWWPVDTGLEGDPQYFAVYWLAYLQVDADESVAFEMASDDDSWAYIDGVQIGDLGGIHGLAITDFSVDLTAGKHVLQLFMAERHTVDSGFWFKWDSEGVHYYACP
jgi:fibro-slime domain-containing protein